MYAKHASLQVTGEQIHRLLQIVKLEYDDVQVQKQLSAWSVSLHICGNSASAWSKLYNNIYLSIRLSMMKSKKPFQLPNRQHNPLQGLVDRLMAEFSVALCLSVLTLVVHWCPLPYAWLSISDSCTCAMSLARLVQLRLVFKFSEQCLGSWCSHLYNMPQWSSMTVLNLLGVDGKPPRCVLLGMQTVHLLCCWLSHFRNTPSAIVAAARGYL